MGKAIPPDQSLAHDRMYMAVPARQIAKGLYRPYITGFTLSGSASLVKPISDRFIGQPTELAQRAAVVAKENAQPLRHGQDP